MKRSKIIISILCTVALCLPLFALTAFAVNSDAAIKPETDPTATPAESWGTAWATAHVDPSFHLESRALAIPAPKGTTIRTKMFANLSGEKVRIRFTNFYGVDDLVLESCTVASASDVPSENSNVTSTPLPLTFGGENKVIIPPGQSVYCDEFAMSIKSGHAMSVSVYLPKGAPLRTAGLTGGVSFATLGNKTMANDFTVKIALNVIGSTIIPFVSAVEVLGKDLKTIAIIGDSTIANDIPGMLQSRILEHNRTDIGVAGVGIIGNRVLSENEIIPFREFFGERLVKRTTRDALDLEGIEYLIVKCGVNDLMQAVERGRTDYPNAEEIIAGYDDIVKQSTDKNVKVLFLPITSWRGFGAKNVTPDGNWTPQIQKIADDVNLWIEAFNAKQGVSINLDVLNDLANPNKLSDEYSTDGAHFTEEGQLIVANSIPLSFFGIKDAEKTEATTRFVIELKGSVVSPFIIFAVVILILFVAVTSLTVWGIASRRKAKKILKGTPLETDD